MTWVERTMSISRRGRPRKAANERHENRLEINLNDFWLAELEAFAAEHDLPPRTAARMLLVGKLKDQGNTLIA